MKMSAAAIRESEMQMGADVVPWIALIGAASSAVAVFKYYQDRAKAREERAKYEQALSDRVSNVERAVIEAKEEGKDAHSAATSARAHAELARQELHQAQLDFARDHVSKTDLSNSEERLVKSMDQLREELHGFKDILHRALFDRARRVAGDEA